MPKLLSQPARPFLLLVLALLLAGCFRLGNNNNMTFGLEEFLPADWTPVGDVIEVDIDGDADIERLLFYHYDRSGESAGPVGALIFDLRQGETTVTTEGEPLARQSSSSLVRHQILPSYWQGAGQGFIAEPDQAGDIPVYTVTYPGSDVDPGNSRKELVVLGGNTYLTFIWWRGRMDGYGVTQLYAPGGFEGVDWTAYSRQPEPITQVIGLYPLHDRSLICRRVGYDRVDVEPVNLALDDATVAYRQTIAYRSSNRGLDFCYGIPTSPFYPEAVVLAYLLDPQNHLPLLDSTLQEDPEAARLRDIIDPAQLILVDDLRSPIDVPFLRPDPLAFTTPIETSVCAKVIVWTDQATSAYTARWLLFTLRYQISQPETVATDQLLITNVIEPARPADNSELTCEQILKNAAQ